MISRIVSWFFLTGAYAADQIVTIPANPLDPSGANPSAQVGQLVNHILNGLLAVGYPLAFLSMVVSAYLLISSQGKPDAYTKARKNLTYLCIGIFLIVAATALVRFFVSAACTTTGSCFNS